MSDFSSVLGKLAGKVMNAANSSEELMCLGKCDKITKHISISYADFMLADSSGGLTDTLSSILGTSVDLVPAVLPLTLGNSYACICCSKIRFHGGALSSQMYENIKDLYLEKK